MPPTLWTEDSQVLATSKPELGTKLRLRSRHLDQTDRYTDRQTNIGKLLSSTLLIHLAFCSLSDTHTEQEQAKGQRAQWVRARHHHQHRARLAIFPLPASRFLHSSRRAKEREERDKRKTRRAQGSQSVSQSVA